MLTVADRDVLLVGGGTVAARRAGALLEAGARLRVVSPALGAALTARHEAGEIAWQARGYRAGDCRGAFLVVVATSDPAVNARAAAEALDVGALLNDAENPARGTVAIPATLRRGRLRISISSGGASPALTAFVRAHLEERLGPELEALTELAARMRDRGKAAGLGAAAREGAAADALPRLLALLEAGRAEEAVRLADELATGATPLQSVGVNEARAWS